MKEPEKILVLFYENQSAYYDGHDFMEKEFDSRLELEIFLGNLKLQYPNVIYTVQNKNNH